MEPGGDPGHLRCKPASTDRQGALHPGSFLRSGEQHGPGLSRGRWPRRGHSEQIEITQPLTWPVQDDPAYEDKLRDFVKQRLANVGAFVLFDESSHRQIELPGAWEELQETAQAGY